MYELTIFIPTKDRSIFLISLIKNLLKSSFLYKNKVHYLIVDGSRNSSLVKLKKLFNNNHSFDYIHSDLNSLDSDILTNVRQIKSEYVWFMSDDDGIYQDSFAQIFKIINDHPDASGFSFNYQGYDKTLINEFHTHPASNMKLSAKIVLSDDLIKSLGAHLGYMPAHIFKVSLLKKISHKKFIKDYKAWVIPFLILNMPISPAKYWFYSTKKLVRYRTGNDSFLSNGLYKRQQLMFNGFFNLIKKYSTKETYKFFLNNYLKKRLLRNLVSFKMRKPSFADQYRFFILLKKHYYWNLFFYFLCLILFIPNFIFLFVKYFYRRYI
jgi:hypothetical protein